MHAALLPLLYKEISIVDLPVLQIIHTAQTVEKCVDDITPFARIGLLKGNSG